MKKIIGICLIFVLILSGCASGSSGSESGSSSESGVQTLTLWSVETENKDYVEKAVKNYNDSHEDSKIQVEFFDDESLKTKMKVAIAGNKLPDLFTYWSGQTFQTLAETGLVADISENIAADEQLSKNILPGGYDSLTFDGKTYGIPLGLSAVALFYNKTIFEENGLELPKTYNELLTVVDELNAKGITPITVSGKDRWPVLHWYSYLAQRIGGVEAFEKAKNGETDFTEPSFVEAGEKLQELAIERKGFVTGFLGLDSSAAESLFVSGKAAMYLQGEWAMRAFVDSDSFSEQVGFIPFPTVEGGKGNANTFHGGFGIGMAISANADKEVAFEALKFLTSPEQRTEIYQDGDIPPMDNVELNAEEMNPLVYEFQNYMLDNATGFFGYYDQVLDTKRADQFLNITSTIVGSSDVDVKAELSKIKE
jgi:raffinose/stachyose/melibiose transport system substrate-binding protein